MACSRCLQQKGCYSESRTKFAGDLAKQGKQQFAVLAGAYASPAWYAVMGSGPRLGSLPILPDSGRRAPACLLAMTGSRATPLTRSQALFALPSEDKQQSQRAITFLAGIRRQDLEIRRGQGLRALPWSLLRVVGPRWTKVLGTRPSAKD